MARYNFGSFIIPNLPRDLYALLKAHKEATGKSSWQIVVEALNAHLGNIPSPSPVQTVPTTPTPPPPSLDKFSRDHQPGDKPSELGPDFVIRRGSTVYLGGPRATEEPASDSADHGGADSSHRVGGRGVDHEGG